MRASQAIRRCRDRCTRSQFLVKQWLLTLYYRSSPGCKYAAFAAWRQERVFLVTTRAKPASPVNSMSGLAMPPLMMVTAHILFSASSGSTPMVPSVLTLVSPATLIAPVHKRLLTGLSVRSMTPLLPPHLKVRAQHLFSPSPKSQRLPPLLSILNPHLSLKQKMVPPARSQRRQLPTGLRAVIDQASQMIISGAPTRSGAYSTSYRISERRIRNTVTGNEVNIDSLYACRAQPGR